MVWLSDEGREEGRTGVAREFCYEAVGEGHYMFGGWRWREGGFGRKRAQFSRRRCSEGIIRNEVLQGRVRDISIELIACYVRGNKP